MQEETGGIVHPVDDRPEGLHDGYACANDDCIHQPLTPIVGVRFVCTVCTSTGGKKGERLSYCDRCWEGHDPKHDLIMYRVPAADASRSRTKQKYAVLEVLAHREIGQVIEYSINWAGPYWHTWETKTHLENDELIADYWKRVHAYDAAKKKKNKRPRRA
jgi:hypothetical protein